MTITKHGIKNPIPHDELFGIRGVYNSETGMNGGMFVTKWPVEAGTRFFLTTDHEDVGLVTWYEAPSLEEADQFLDRLKCSHTSTHDVGEEPDGSTIVECDNCQEQWNEGVDSAQKVYPSSSQAGLASFQHYTI